MFLKRAEVIAVLKMSVDLFGVDFNVFMHKDVAQPNHWLNALGKIASDYFLRGDNFKSMPIVAGPDQVVGGNYMMTNIKERLYVDF